MIKSQPIYKPIHLSTTPNTTEDTTRSTLIRKVKPVTGTENACCDVASYQSLCGGFCIVRGSRRNGGRI